MKTFETEKNNIPEGATHYSDSSDERFFSWFMRTGDEWFIKIWSDKDWVKCKHNEQDKSGVKPIPQTKDVEWINGNDVEAYGKLYKYVGLDPFNDNLCICLANEHDDPQCFSIEVLNKPETEAERVERERLEWIEKWVSKIKHIGTMTYKDILGEMHDSLK